MTAIVDPNICIGCTLCTQLCPSIYRMESEKAVAYTNPVPKESLECARNGAEQCPVQAIVIEP